MAAPKPVATPKATPVKAPVTPIVTVKPTTTATSFVGPIPTGTTRTATGYVPTPTSPTAAQTATAAAAAAAAAKAAADKAAADAKTAAANKDKAAADKAAADKAAADKNLAELQAQIDALNAANAKNDYDAAQAAAAKITQDQNEKRDAFALIQDTMRAYGFTDTELSELSGFIEKSIIDPNVGPNQAILNMRNLAVYQGRFAGNKTRLDKGLNALSEADYLQQEKDYGQYFQQYGVANLATRAQMATMIGNDIAPTEAKTRIGLAVDRVKNSDPQVMAQLKTYYPTLTDADLVTYFLKPEQVLPELQKKVTASEIGAAAVGQNLATTNALDLANYGVDRATAIAGYSDIKSVLPTSGKLSDIYGEAGIKYDQTAAESEFFKQNQDAAEKRRRLKSMERASFTGATSANLSRTQQGQF